MNSGGPFQGTWYRMWKVAVVHSEKCPASLPTTTSFFAVQRDVARQHVNCCHPATSFYRSCQQFTIKTVQTSPPPY